MKKATLANRTITDAASCETDFGWVLEQAEGMAMRECCKQLHKI
jgi:hypothetical protein